MIALRILVAILSLPFLIVFFLGLLIRFRHWIYEIIMFSLALLLFGAVHFIFAATWAVSAIIMSLFVIIPRLLSWSKIYPELKIYINSKEDSLKLNLEIPLMFLSLLKLIPNSAFLDSEHKPDASIKEFIKIIIQEGRGSNIDVQSPKADVRINIT